MKDIEQINELTQEIIKSAIDVHRTLGPGLPESDYRSALTTMLAEGGFKVEAQPIDSMVREDQQLDAECKIDLLIEDQVILEIKSIDQLTQKHQAQLTACLVASGYGVGLLINFNVENLELGIKRVINTVLYDL